MSEDTKVNLTEIVHPQSVALHQDQTAAIATETPQPNNLTKLWIDAYGDCV